MPLSFGTSRQKVRVINSNCMNNIPVSVAVTGCSVCTIGYVTIIPESAPVEVLSSFNQLHQESKNWLRTAAAQVMHALHVKVIHPQHVKGNICIAQYDVMAFFTITLVKRWTQISKIPLWIVVSDTVFKSCFTSLLLKCMVKVKWWRECEEMMSVLQRRQGNACLHTVTCTRPSLEQFKWETFAHPECSPDFIPIDMTHPSTWSNFGCP